MTQPRRREPDGQLTFVIGEVEFFCGDQRIVDPLEQRIAFILSVYGTWPMREELEFDGNDLVALEHHAAPDAGQLEVEGNGLVAIGLLSSIVSSVHLRDTHDDESRLMRISANFTPGQFGRLIPENYESAVLPLGRARMTPANS
jgi:hypothetical protein